MRSEVGDRFSEEIGGCDDSPREFQPSNHSGSRSIDSGASIKMEESPNLIGEALGGVGGVENAYLA